MFIIYAPGGGGWEPITYMVQLAAELLEAELVSLPPTSTRKPLSFLRKIRAILPGPRGTESCLLVCKSPTDLLHLFRLDSWRKWFREVAAWIIDCFWTDHIPRTASYSRAFDQLFITTLEDIPAWTRAMGTPTAWLPWGTDALRLGTRQSERSWDLLRVGRQPPEWDDDAATEQACLARSLRFHGRPEGRTTAEDNQRRLMQLYGESKFTLAFSNLVNRESYVHKTRGYVTARWVDALAGGAVVAGIPPRSPSVDSLLWPGATLDLGTIRRDAGLNVIADAVRCWRPEQAEANALKALEHLDWRWRFLEIANHFRVSPKRLEQELHLLRQAVEKGRKGRETETLPAPSSTPADVS